MKFGPLFLKLLQFLDIQGSISDSNIYMMKWLFYTYLLGISSDEMMIMAWNVYIMFLQYLY